MNLDLKELRSKAMAATPGDWQWSNPWKEDGHHSGAMGELKPGVLWYGMDGEENIYCPNRADAEFIAAFNPQVALALLDRIDACLKYSANHTDQMWAASIVGHLLGCDFRDAKEALKKYAGDV